MTRRELIAAVVEQTGLPKGDVEAVVNALFQQIKGCLAEGDKISIPSFGTFLTQARTARTGRHPSTGQPIEIPARAVPVFRPATALKEALYQPLPNARKHAAPRTRYSRTPRVGETDVGYGARKARAKHRPVRPPKPKPKPKSSTTPKKTK